MKQRCDNIYFVRKEEGAIASANRFAGILVPIYK